MPLPSAAPDTVFQALRRRLQGIAYRMLGSQADAEDLVQDTWLRWHATATTPPDNPEAWLITVTTRLAIDRLRAAKLQRAHYVGTWLPEPLLQGPDDGPASPEQLLERVETLSVAFLALLERLGPEARAAYLLHEVFDTGYDEIAATLGKSEAACRQLVHRARRQVQDAQPRHVVPPQAQQRLLRSFADAASRGDLAGLKALLADDARLVGDGGGVVPSFGVPLRGGQRIAQLFLATQLRHRGAVRFELVALNGEWGLLRFIGGALESAQALQTDGQRILGLHVQRNPTKLAHIARALGCALHTTLPAA